MAISCRQAFCQLRVDLIGITFKIIVFSSKNAPLVDSKRVPEIPTPSISRIKDGEEDMSSDSDSPETTSLSGWALVTPHGDVEV